MPASELIAVEGLVKDFGKTKVLQNINVTISKGEVVAVIGPSGSGKSTFLRCLNLLEQPTGGHIFLKGWISATKRQTSTCTARRSAWCSSSSTCSII